MPRLSPRLLIHSFSKNLPKAYIDKEKGIKPKKIFGNRFGAPDIVTYDIHPDDYIYGEHMPWDLEAKKLQKESQKTMKRWDHKTQHWSHDPPKVFNEPQENWLMFVGDRVEVLVGKDKGKQGYICDIVRERNWCYVEGLNCKYEYREPPGYSKQVLPVAQKLDMSTEVALVDPADERSTTVEWRYTELGDRVRISKRSGREIPIPGRALETIEYKSPETYVESKQDTPAKLVEKATYVPDLTTFEEDIMKEYSIKEDRIYGKSYWY